MVMNYACQFAGVQVVFLTMQLVIELVGSACDVIVEGVAQCKQPEQVSRTSSPDAGTIY